MQMQSNQKETRQPSGMKGFIVVWLGQIVSVLASGMTQSEGCRRNAPLVPFSVPDEWK